MIRSNSTARRLIAALISALLLAGCAHVRPADPTAVGVDLDDINAKLAGRMVRVRFVDGAELIAHDVRISAGSVSFRRQRFPHLESPWPAREVQELPISDVASIAVTRRGWGAADGALLGLGIGVVAGAAIGVAMFRVPGELYISSTGDAALVGGVMFGVLGTGLGFLIGLGLGSSEVFDLTKAPFATGSAPISE